MIVVQVKLFATLRHRFPDLAIGEAIKLELAAGTTVAQLIQQLELPDRAKVVFVNNIIREEDHVLQAGDVVGIFPPVGGG